MPGRKRCDESWGGKARVRVAEATNPNPRVGFCPLFIDVVARGQLSDTVPTGEFPEGSPEAGAALIRPKPCGRPNQQKRGARRLESYCDDDRE